MKIADVLKDLKKFGNPGTKKVFLRHGAKEPFYGVKVGDLKKIQKKTKQDHKLSLELYKTGISDAMYLAGLIAEPERMTKAELNSWANGASWYMISDYTVAGVAAESKYGMELALKWIDSKKELVVSAGWATLAGIVSMMPDDDLPIAKIEKLLQRVRTTIHSCKNRVRYAMNTFVISVGGYVRPLSKQAMAVAKEIGNVEVDMGGTSCKVPLATEYIKKMISRNPTVKKRTSTRC